MDMRPTTTTIAIQNEAGQYSIMKDSHTSPKRRGREGMLALGVEET